jgi:hypothetical protein
MILIVADTFLYVYNAASVWLSSQMLFKCIDCNLRPGCYLNTFGYTREAVGPLTVTLNYRALLRRIKDKSPIVLIVCDCDQRAEGWLCILHETYCCGDGSGMLF